MITKNKYIGYAALAIAMLAAGCDIHHYHPLPQDRTADLSRFSGVSLYGAGNVAIYPGRDLGVVVTADVDVVDDIATAVDTNRVLCIGELERDAVGNIVKISGSDARGAIGVDVRTPELNGVALAGRGKVKVAAPAGAAAPSGGHLMILLTGEGEIDAREYMASCATVILTGEGSVKVWAAETLFVSITALKGEVVYRGNPKIVMFDHIKLFEKSVISDGIDPPLLPPSTVEPPIASEDDIDRGQHIYNNSVKEGNTPSSLVVPDNAVSGKDKDPTIWLEESTFEDMLRPSVY